MCKAVFFDRDGTVIEECNYLEDPEQVALLPGAAQAIGLLKEKGFLTVIVTNQSGIARGYFDIPTLQQVHAKMKLLLAADGVTVDGIYYCPHYPGGIVPPFNIDCHCRKPQTGLALQAQKELAIDLNHSYMIGDKEVDVDFGKNFGAKAAILVATGYGKDNPHTKADYQAKDLMDAAAWILKNELSS